MAIAHVQTKNASMDAASSISINFNQGNCAVVFAAGWQSGSSPTITGVSGTSSGAWDYGVVTTSISNRQEGFYVKKNLAAGSDTITVAWSVPIANARIEVTEYSGVNLTNPICGSNMIITGFSSTTHDINLVATKSDAMYIYGIHALGDSPVTGNGTERSKAVNFLGCQVMDSIGTISAVSGIWTLTTSNFVHMLALALEPNTTRTMIKHSLTLSVKTTDSRMVVY